MKPQSVVSVVSLCAALCLTGMASGGDKENQAAVNPQLAQLYVQLLGTSP
ncbi:MAG: hypothetical protein H8E44_43330 [Planctomycetes bacterium]|nr:hypothetical protein [Planctomycetota bacterium]MBL7042842.1 hypothetical protein [Pirellulaceae bacterium]